jgi:hypothetical protein
VSCGFVTKEITLPERQSLRKVQAAFYFADPTSKSHLIKMSTPMETLTSIDNSNTKLSEQRCPETIATLNEFYRSVTVPIREWIGNERTSARHTFRNELMLCESVTKLSHMLVSLENWTSSNTRFLNDRDLAVLESSRAAIRSDLGEQLAAGNLQAMRDIEGRAEKEMRSRDPFWLEKEDLRRENRNRHKADQDKSSCKRPGRMKAPSTRIILLMKNETAENAEVTEEEYESFAMKAAWLCSLLGCLIALIFLVFNFVTAQIHPSIKTNVIKLDLIRIPTITICYSRKGIPSFQHLASSRKTHGAGALFGVASFINLESGETFGSDAAHETVFEPKFIGPLTALCKDRADQFSREHMRIIEDDSYVRSAPDNCLTCFQTKYSYPVSLNASAQSQQAFGGRAPISFRFASSKVLDFCFASTPYAANSQYDFRSFVFKAISGLSRLRSNHNL